MLKINASGRLFRSFLAVLLAVAMVIPMVPVFEVNAAETNQYDVALYKPDGDPSTWTYPEMEGKVFAGWYTDDTYTTPYTDITGTATAKFVDDDLFAVKRQLNADANLESTKVKIRFLTGIDDRNYNSVTFDVEVPGLGRSWQMKETTAYTSILVEGVESSVKPSDVFGSEANYFVVHSLSNIPSSAFSHDFHVTTRWVTLDGTEVVGSTVTFTIAELLSIYSGQYRLWNVDSLAHNVDAAESVEFETRDNVVGRANAYRGLIGTNGERSTGFTYRVTSIVDGGQKQAETLLMTPEYMEKNGFDTSISVNPEEDVLWVWVHSAMTNGRRLQLEINGMQYYGNVDGGKIYTIVEGADGSPEISTISPANSVTEGVDLQLVKHSGEWARIYVEGGWSGWIGMPLKYFKNISTVTDEATGTSETVTTTLQEGDTINELYFVMGWTTSDAIHTAANRDTGYVYFDEFWLTNDGDMPNLTDAQLLYTVPRQTSLWDLDESNTALYGEQYTTKTDRNTAVGSRHLGGGVGNSNSLAYTQTYTNAYQMTNTLRFLSASALDGSGFNTKATIRAEDDIIWFWLHSDMTNDMRLQIAFNGQNTASGDINNLPDESSYIYTIVDNGAGVPEIKKICYTAYNSSIDGIGWIATKAAGDTYGQIKVQSGWSGWVGVPANLVLNDALAVGATFSKLEILARMTNNVDGTLSSQKAGDAIYFDEFWLTEAGAMPNLPNDQLLYTAPRQTSLWDVDSVTDGAAIGTVGTTATRDTISATAAAGKGLLSALSEKTNAFAYTVTQYISGTQTQANNVTMSSSQLSGAGFDTSAKLNATDDVFWFWVDSELTTDQRLELRLNDRCFYQQDAAGNKAYAYSIVVDASGNQRLVKVPLEDSANDTDIRSGVALMPHSEWTRLYIESGWSGWIGLPMNFFAKPDSSDADGDGNKNESLYDSVYAVGNCITKMAIVMGWTNKDGAYSSRDTGAIYFDEFWLTSNGMMPALLDSQMISYKENAQQLWDLDDTSSAIANEYIEDIENRNDVVANLAMGFGLKDSNALSYTITEVLSTGAALMSDTLQFRSAAALANNGFNTSAKLTTDQDIIWFWMDSQMSMNTRLQISVNDAQLGGGKVTAGSTNPNFYIYTIVENTSGKPEMKKIEHTVCYTDVSTSGIALVNQGSTNMNTTSQLLVAPGWSGWVGIPANVLVSGGTIGAGDTIKSFSVLARVYAEDSGSQLVYDSIYFDEFWLTTPLTMPNLSDAELLYKADHTANTASDYLADSSLFVPTWSVSTSANYFKTPSAMMNFTEKYNSFMDPDGRLMSVAHRGDRNTFYPENSVEAYLSAIAMGADMVEVDIAKTSDGYLVCLHVDNDDSDGINELTRTNVEQLRARGVTLPTSNNISDWTLAQLQQLRLIKSNGVVTNYCIPTLEDVIKVCNNRCFITLDKTSEFEWADVLKLIKAQQAYLSVLVPYNYSGSYYSESYAPGLVDALTDLAGKQAPFMTEWYTAEAQYIASSLTKAKRIISTYGMPKVLRSGEYDVDGGMDSYYSQVKDSYRVYGETLSTYLVGEETVSKENAETWAQMRSKGVNLIMTNYKILDLVKYIAATEFAN